MFDMSDRLADVFAESADGVTDNNPPLNIHRVAPRMADGGNQKIFLPPGSGTVPLLAALVLLPRLKKRRYAELGH